MQDHGTVDVGKAVGRLDGKGRARHRRGVGPRRGDRAAVRRRGCAGRRARPRRGAAWDEVTAASPGASFHVADVTDEDAVAAAVAAVLDAARASRRGRELRGRRRRRARPHGPARRVPPRHGRQPRRHVPRVQARARPDDGAALGQHREHRVRRGDRRYRGRQRVQRVEGRRRAAHEEHGDRLRPHRDPRELHLPGLHRHADVPFGGRRTSARSPTSTATSTSSGASAGPRRSRRPRCSSRRTTRRSSPGTRWSSTAATRSECAPSCSTGWACT